MFDWVEVIKPNGSEHHLYRAQITAIKKHELPERDSITVLGQFFCAPSALLAENSMLQLPAHTLWSGHTR